jgi:hypothetical protein
MKAVFNSGKNNRFPSKLTIGKSYDVISEARPDDAYTYYLVLCDGVEKKYTGKQIYINRSIENKC